VIDAVIRSGGKQYRVHAGSVLDVATLDAAPGSRVELREVLLVSDGDKVTVGNPTVADALVVAEVVEHGKGRKVISFKYKAKTRYRRKRGHRQGFTKLSVKEIRHGDAVATAPERRAAPPEPEPAAPAPRRRARAQAPAEAPAVEPTLEEAPKPAPRRRTRAQATPEPAAEAKAAPRRRARASKTQE